MRRLLMLAMAVAVVAATFSASHTRAVAQKRVRVALPEGTVLDTTARPVVSPDGSVGFVTPAVGDTVVAFAVRTGETLGRLADLGPASGITLHEDGSRRLLVVTLANDPEGGRPSSVAVVDATSPSELKVVATFVLPDSARLAPGARAEVARGQRFGVVAIVAPVAALLSFDISNGLQIGALTLDGAPDRIAIVDAGDASRVAIVSATTNEVAVVSIDDTGVLLPASTFTPPADAPISTANNVVFDAAGHRGYVASLKGRALMSFSLESGELVDRIATDGSSAAITVYHMPEGDLVAVANVSRPGGDPAADVEPSSVEPLGLPGAVVVAADADGKLAERARFYPETGEEIAPSNNPEFSADGSVVYVPSRTGALYAVDAATGQTRGREGLDHRVQSIAAAPLAEAVAVVSAGGSEGRLDVVAPSIAPVEPEPGKESKEDRATRREERLESDRAEKEADERGGASFAAERLSPSVVQAGRRRDLPITVIGSGFGPGATVLVNGTNFGAIVSPNGKRANFTISASLLAAPAVVPVQVRNPDGSLSNAINLEVVSPYAPTVVKVNPGKIDSGGGGVDLKVRGDHFRDGALVRVSYVDAAGAQQTVELKTYRLSFTSIIARLPHRLTVRAEEFSLTVTDRDGATASQPTPVRVVGPTVAGIVPERVVAGDLRGKATLALHITGENFHTNAVVFVQRPARGDATEPFRLVPAASVRRKSATKIVFKLTPTDLAYSGTLAVRVVNPVPGEKRRNGDASTFNFTVAGPVITSTSPEVIIAGRGEIILKLEGADFRRGSTVKLQRADGAGEAEKRVFVDDPNFKDRKQINIEMNTPELLRLISRPGELHVRVINPSVGRGDPSPVETIQVVGPSITASELVPSENDPTEYRLTLTGIFFAEGATVQLFTADGTAVGQPIETRLKSQEEIVVRLARRRVTDLRTFKIVVINPGGPYNPDGVRSNPLDVTVN